MKYKVLFLLFMASLLSVNAQRGVRIGYIDTEYILQNVPEYQEAVAQLDKKVIIWKTDIEKQLSEIELKKKELENESVLLTKELYDERAEDIAFEESKIIDSQQNIFGPTGALMIQKRQLISPVQDQIFAAVQEIAKLKKYDFIFDKSADVVMLYSANRYDISDQVLKTITRTSKRQQTKSKRERQALEDEEVIPEVNKELDEKQKERDSLKASREKQLEDRRAQRENDIAERKKRQDSIKAIKLKNREDYRHKVIDARDNKSKSKGENDETTEPNDETTTSNEKAENVEKTAEELKKEKQLKKIKDREARAKALEEKRKRIMEEKRKAREARVQRRDSIAKAKKQKND